MWDDSRDRLKASSAIETAVGRCRHIEELSLLSPKLPTFRALPGCPLVLPRAMAGFIGARGAAGRTRGGVGGLWAKGQSRVLALLSDPTGVNPTNGSAGMMHDAATA